MKKWESDKLRCLWCHFRICCAQSSVSRELAILGSCNAEQKVSTSQISQQIQLQCPIAIQMEDWLAVLGIYNILLRNLHALCVRVEMGPLPLLLIWTEQYLGADGWTYTLKRSQFGLSQGILVSNCHPGSYCRYVWVEREAAHKAPCHLDHI